MSPERTGAVHRFPEFMDDGEHFFYLVTRATESKRGIYVASLSDPAGHRWLADQSSVVYVPPSAGRSAALLFMGDDALMAVPFDRERLELAGEPVTVARQVSRTNTIPQIAVSASASGTVVYLGNATVDRMRQAAWVERSGKELDRFGAPAVISALALSRDEKTPLTARLENGEVESSLWVHDLVRNTTTRLTSPGQGAVGVWSPDGSRVAFASQRSLYARSIGEDRAEQLLDGGANVFAPSDWSRDGRYLVFTSVDQNTGPDIWVLPLASGTSPSKPFPFLATRFSESHGQLSADNRRMAYTSTEPGDNDVYVRSFPSGDRRFRVSTSGGREPRWRGDGKELYYLEGKISRLQLMAVSFDGTSVGTPHPLFSFRSSGGTLPTNWFQYAPSSGGQRFLINRFASDALATVDVLVNWPLTDHRREP